MSSAIFDSQIILPNTNSDALRSEVYAILLLLASAVASLQTHAAGDGCIDILTACVSRIQKQNELTDRDVGEGMVWKEISICGILRILDYLKLEIREQLNDLQSVEELGFCIDCLNPAKSIQ